MVYQPTTIINMPQQHHHHQQVTGSSTKLDLDNIDAFLGAKNEELEQHGDVTFKDQVREDLLSSSLATSAASAAAVGGRAAAHEIPMVCAVAVSQSQISAEAEEDRQRDAERRVAAAAADAVRDQVAQLERKLAAVRPPHQAPHHSRQGVNHYDDDDIDDINDEGYND
jgi:hypothetical protein